MSVYHLPQTITLRILQLSDSINTTEAKHNATQSFEAVFFPGYFFECKCSSGIIMIILCFWPRLFCKSQRDQTFIWLWCPSIKNYYKSRTTSLLVQTSLNLFPDGYLASTSHLLWKPSKGWIKCKHWTLCWICIDMHLHASHTHCFCLSTKDWTQITSVITRKRNICSESLSARNYSRLPSIFWSPSRRSLEPSSLLQPQRLQCHKPQLLLFPTWASRTSPPAVA